MKLTQISVATKWVRFREKIVGKIHEFDQTSGRRCSGRDYDNQRKGEIFQKKKKKQLEKCPDANVSPRNMTNVLGRA